MTGLILWLARLWLVLAFGAGPAFAAPSSVAVLLSDEAPCTRNSPSVSRTNS
jgi:hypothetical protein